MAIDANQPMWQFESEARKRKKERFKPKSTLDDLQSGLTAAGMTPVVWAAPDLANLIISILRLNPKSALTNAASFVPGPLGWTAGAGSLATDVKERTKPMNKPIASSDQVLKYLKDV